MGCEMKSKWFRLLLVAVFMWSPAAFAGDQDSSVRYVRQQMVLFGLYNYGINQELSKTNPDLGELQFLAESALEIANKAIKSQSTRLRHQNYDELLGKLEKLKTLSQKRRRLEAIEAAKEVMQACSQCHMAGNQSK